jgi:chaperonin cofactor prefoldin
MRCEVDINPDKQFINAISTVLYKDEADILEGIQAVIPNDDSVKPQIDYITKTGNELDDWSWDGRLLRKAGKIFVPKVQQPIHQKTIRIT